MGLTIHYTLSTRELLADAAVRSLVAEARGLARESEVDAVSRLLRVGPHFPLAHEWVAAPPPEDGPTHVDVPPQDGHLSSVTLG